MKGYLEIMKPNVDHKLCVKGSKNVNIRTDENKKYQKCVIIKRKQRFGVQFYIIGTVFQGHDSPIDIELTVNILFLLINLKIK